MEGFLKIFDLQSTTDMILVFVPRIASAILILLLFWLGYLPTSKSLRLILQKAGIDPTLIRMLVNNVYRFTLLGVGIIMAASQLGINVTAALTGLGVAGVAFGFAAQDTLANLIAGFMIFWDQPFRVGDFVTTNEQYGRVTNITMRTTRIRTQENTYVVIPNKNIIDSVLVNHTKHGDIRVNVPIGIAYKESIAQARQVMLAAVREIDGVLDNPAPEVVALELGDSSVNLEVRVWIHSAMHERPVGFQVVEACKMALDTAGIQIPFPHLQIFVDDIEERVWQKAALLPALGGRGADA